MSLLETKINYYDLILEALSGRLLEVQGREAEYQMLERICNRRMSNHVFVHGPSGVGKTAFARGLAHVLLKKSVRPHLVELDLSDITPHLSQHNTVRFLTEALQHVPYQTMILIDEFGSLVYNKPQILDGLLRALKPLITEKSVRLIMTGQEHEMQWLSQEWHYFTKFCTPLKLDEPKNIADILQITALQFPNTTFMPEVFTTLIALHGRFPQMGAAPGILIRLLDDAVSLTKLHRQGVVTPGIIRHVTAELLHISPERLQYSAANKLHDLRAAFDRQIIGQRTALDQIYSIMQRAELGLKNNKRPRGSFLVLGPSGVGKTETAKVLATSLFGGEQHVVRFDMSEFSESHTAQRLVGAPPGYVGYDAGGELTTKLAKQPDALVLLDEIEKAHPKIFDIFLQVLDDGRITSGSGQTVDCTQAIFYATSNIASGLIDGLWRRRAMNETTMIQELLPELQKYFRTEFINRFDAIVVFHPLSDDDLFAVAKLEIQKIEARAPQPVHFDIDEMTLRRQIAQRAVAALGARPIKRFIEEVCESLLAQHLMERGHERI